MGPPGMEQGVPMPYAAVSRRRPGIRLPWPEDEYLRDGGNDGHPVGPGKGGEVLGLNMEDTVAEYETLDHRKVVEPSNEVYIYAPRFVRCGKSSVSWPTKSIRRWWGLQSAATGGADHDATRDQHEAERATGRPDQRPARLGLRTKQGDGVMSMRSRQSFQDAFKPYENLSIIRLGEYDESEMAFLARGSTAAITWSHTQAVQVIIDHKAAMADVKYDKVLTTYTVDSPPGCPQLRLLKVASTPFANPGDTVDFTIRFDNLGNQPIGNVQILDSLNTRLEFIPGSAQCSVDATFSTQPNEGDSVVLRCELSHPLDIGRGGILRFRCRVR